MSYNDDYLILKDMNKTISKRKPQIAVEKPIHDLIKSIATQRKDNIEKVTEEVIIAGLKVKRLLPENFQTATN